MTVNAIVRPEWENEPVDFMLKRLKKQLDRSATLSTYRDHEHFATKAARRKIKSDRARKRLAGRVPR